ncbi:hypothetical protein [Marinitenerispora sediminis]|uniref:hypothetical protein n=1 Tax=Marinitenerispora sediminis TaxID=1931232 RepID=UPI0011C0320C|nr:hypothetical protein [Marinitenerispora sediminis]
MTASLLLTADAVTPRQSGRHRRFVPAQRPAADPSRIPDYAEFASMALRHGARWEITYRTGDPTPYRARHRAVEISLASDDLHALDCALAAFEPPPSARPYVLCRQAAA